MSMLTVTFTPPSLGVTIQDSSLTASTGIPIAREYVERPAYEGEYDVTPSAEGTVLPTQYLRMTDNVRIAPIPNNYGLITWNGSTLTVS